MKLEPHGETLLVNGLQLTSNYDRVREAKQIADTVPHNAEEVYVYGCAFGDTIRALLERPTIQKVHAVIMNREIAKACGSQWSDSPRVTYSHGHDHEAPHAPFVISPVEVRFSDDDCYHLRDRLNAAINDSFNRFLFQTMQVIWKQHEAANAEAIKAARPVSELFSKDRSPAIVIGGGPTLANHYAWIKERVETHSIITASTALLPLERAGIDPHVTVMIDRDPKMVRHVEGARATGVLVFHPAIPPGVLAAWKGARYVCWDGDLFGGGSVVHHQIDLAWRMGARDVTLVGCDFGYPSANKASHVDGAAIPYDASGLGKLSVRNGYGQPIPTDENLSQYRVFVEDYVKARPGVRWSKLGKEGAECRGVEWA
jgi:hypothetical protein